MQAAGQPRAGTTISVVVPVYNGERHLAACLSSIAVAVAALERGRRARVEVIVCDNHSSDRSLEIAEQAAAGCELRIVQPPAHEANRTRNWAHGLALARGAWMQMLHADDELSPQALIRQLAVAEDPRSRSASLISGRHRFFEHDGERGRLRPVWLLPGIIDGPRFARSVLPLHCPLVPFTLMRRELYEQLGGLDPRWELVQDWELWMRLAQRGPIVTHPHEVGRWRLHPVSPAYRRQNAREHVGLAGTLERIVPEISASTARRARSVASARATVMIEGLEGDETARPTAHDAERARHVLRANARLVSARIAALRSAGLARWPLTR